jgi:gliding motility-associated-like protein
MNRINTIASAFLLGCFSLLFSTLLSSQSLPQEFDPKTLANKIQSSETKSSFISKTGATEDELNTLKCEYTFIAKKAIDLYSGKLIPESKYQEITDSLLNIFEKIHLEYKTTGTIHHHHDNDNFELSPRMKMPKRNENVKGRKNVINEFVYGERSTCVNADFENGNVNGWEGAYASTSGEANLAAGWDMGAQNSNNGNHTIMGPGAGNDGPSGNAFPRVFPGGAYSLRLGNQDVGWQAAQVRYTFPVTEDTELFLYHFAAVMEDPGHTPEEQPYLRINLIIDGQNIECGEYFQVAEAGAQGFLNGPGNVRYRPWTTVSIALTDYIGQTATIEFTTADCSQAGHFGYAYIDAECSPMPVLDTDTLTCDNPQIQLSAPAGADAYQWTGPGIIGPTNTQSVTVNAEGIYTVTVTPVQGPACAYSLTTEIIDQSSDVDPGFTANPTQICPGESVQFTDQSINNGVLTITNWSWDFGDGGTSTQQNPTHQYNAPGTYTVTMTVTTEDGCNAIHSEEIIVSAIPDPSFTYIGVCEGNPIVMTNTSEIEAPHTITGYEWDILNNGINNYFTENATHTFNGNGTFEVALTATSDGGCSNTVVQNITVWADPTASFSHVPACEGDPFQFNDQSTGNGGNINTWQWNFGDGNTSNQQNPSHSYASFGTYTVTLTVTTQDGCSDEISQEISLLPNPIADFSITNACYQSALSFTDLSENATQWEWNFGDGTGTSSNQNPTYTYQSPGTYTVTLTVYSANGCVDSHQLQAVAYPDPTPGFTSPSVCLGNESTFNNTTQIAPPDFITEYNWSFGDGGTSSEENPAHEYTSQGVYTVTLTVTSNEGCSSSITQQVSVYPLPNVNFSSTSVCMGEITSLTNNSSISNTFTQNSITNFTWHLGDGTVFNNQENIEYIYGEDGTFDVTLIATSNHGCIDSITLPVTVHPLPVVYFISEDTTGCTPVCPVFTDNTFLSSGNIVEYIWDLGTGEEITTFEPVATTCYDNPTHEFVDFYDISLTVITDRGCTGSFSKENNVEVYPIPLADFHHNPEVATTLAPSMQFQNTSIGGNVFHWTFDELGTSTLEHPYFTFPDELGGTYLVELAIMNGFGCVDTTRRVVVIKNDITVYVPNAFTPDGDGINDLFGPVVQGHDTRDFQFLIFNRWGELIFESHQVDRWWDGTHRGVRCQQDVYIWKLIVRSAESAEKHEFIGHVSLLK